MTIKLANIRLLKGSEYDIELEDGDSLFIPEKNSVVNVTGSVMAQGSYVFSEKADYMDYINMSGGYSDYADESNVFVLKVDGSARKARECGRRHDAAAGYAHRDGRACARANRVLRSLKRTAE